MEREARRKLKLCFINVLELAHTHQQRYSRTAEIASTPQKKSIDSYALLVPIICTHVSPHVSPHVNRHVRPHVNPHVIGSSC